MPAAKLRDFLDRNHSNYETIPHALAYTAQEIASRAHIAGKELAKTVVIHVDGELIMAVLPASAHIDTAALRKSLDAGQVRLATELEFKDRFPDCEVGAMPPFGNLYGMPVIVEESLTRDREIAFNAGSHRELIRLPFTDFQRLVNFRVLPFAARRLKLVGGEDRLW